MKKPEILTGYDFLNWAQFSRTLSGSSRVVRRNLIPIKHREIMKEAAEAVETVLRKHGKIE